ncbi:hypothetical protein [uncultured virus]|uniref:Uncharacterized protein n=1 Tax=uncultured virus TaxID=340016 RepID=A0A218MLY6_9VIRU|nr:hypothetical protein [uncultured virus]|tara:strand:- start:96 stop:551 length:456 start_codon:yes stop_codon:yes gene_type:complete
MKNEIATKMSPEGLEIANAYLEYGNIQETATALAVDENTISEWLGKREVKAYIDSVYLDTGYRNRFKIGTILDDIIDQKLKEAEESEVFTSKDIVDLLQMAHKIRMEEIKAQTEIEKAKASSIKSQTNVQINADGFGQGNYGELMKKLLKK